jgi:hypothetical protein
VPIPEIPKFVVAPTFHFAAFEHCADVSPSSSKRSGSGYPTHFHRHIAGFLFLLGLTVAKITAEIPTPASDFSAFERSAGLGVAPGHCHSVCDPTHFYGHIAEFLFLLGLTVTEIATLIAAPALDGVV